MTLANPSTPKLDEPEQEQDANENEPLFRDNKKFVLFPIEHGDIWAMYKKAESSFWTAEEIDLTQDVIDWRDRLNDDERHYIKMVLGFFASTDIIVQCNLLERFLVDVKMNEARFFYNFQGTIEAIHSEVYSLLIDTLIRDPVERQQLFHAIETIPSIKKLTDWTLKWMRDPSATYAQLLVVFACIEGILFSGPFCSIFWLKQRDIMPGLSQSNKLISRDEAIHTEFACLLYNRYITNKPDFKLVLEIIDQAVQFEIEFVKESLPVRLIGMNAELMTEYIKFVADRLIEQLGYRAHYGAKNPFDFMEKISLKNKGNFFEVRETEYSLSNFEGRDTKTGGEKKITLMEDF
jgi:ribonucleoside-diphosphate reductase beta chain